jgi:hypothetical protein
VAPEAKSIPGQHKQTCLPPVVELHAVVRVIEEKENILTVLGMRLIMGYSIGIWID